MEMASTTLNPLYYIISELPLMIATAISGYIAIKLLTPNPKRHGITLGWFFAEFAEHILWPLVILLALLTIPILYIPATLVVTFLVFGRAVGTAKVKRDWLKVLMLYIIFMFFLALPKICMTLSWIYGIDGMLPLGAVTGTSLLAFVASRSDKKLGLSFVPI